MATRFAGPPVDYLRECSGTSLRYFEMSKLEHVANLRRELAVLLDEMMEESALALFARWMLEGRSLPPHASGSSNGSKAAESRKARSLLAEFIQGADPSSGFSAGPPARTRGNGKAPDHCPSEAAPQGRTPPALAKDHPAPHRAVARSEQRLERRASRPVRASPRSPASTQ